MKKRKIILLAALLVFVCSAAIGAFEKGRSSKSKSKEDLYNNVGLFADAVSIIRSDYAEEVDSKKLMYGAMRGMLESLDDYTQFLDPEEYKELQEEAKGEFGGIGIEVTFKDGMVTVITPISGSPAEIAGIKPGDKIVKINSKTTKDMDLNAAVKEMRGKSGTVLNITVWREKDQKILDFSVKRDIIKINSIKEAKFIEDKIGYIKVIEFLEKTPQDLEEALRKLESQGMDSLILDLRNNPGGLLDVAAVVCEKFLPKDAVIVSIKTRDPKQDSVIKSKGAFLHAVKPLVVMVNEGSASAAEIFAGAIQDNKRGMILGTKTFGKASVQAVIQMRDGSALKFTTASYLTPSGRIIRNHGIIPDIIVERDENGAVKKAKAAEIFENLEEKKVKVEKDNQLDMAVNVIKALKVYKGQ